MFQVLTAIGNFCICSIATGMVLEMIIMFASQHRRATEGIANLLVLLIGGIPIAMPTVLSVTMAIGSHRLSQQVCATYHCYMMKTSITSSLLAFILPRTKRLLRTQKSSIQHCMQGAITKRMTAIEEMAGMDVLCSDKTGTLTLNKLSVDKNMIEVILPFSL